MLLKQSEAYIGPDSDPSEEMPLAAARSTATRTTAVAAPVDEPTTKPPSPEEKAKAAPPQVTEQAVPPPSSLPSPDTPSAVDPPPPPPPPRNDRKRSHKKKGRNQYTRDDDSPARSQSRDIQKEKDDLGGGAGSHRTGDNHHAKPRNKGGMSSRITMTDMKRRATALLDFISRTQVELAGETAPSPPEGSGHEPKVNGDSSTTATLLPTQRKQAGGVAPGEAKQNSDVSAPAKEFKELSCMEMMDTLTRRLVKWQQEYTP
jgi:hypothetical protein